MALYKKNRICTRQNSPNMRKQAQKTANKSADSSKDILLSSELIKALLKGDSNKAKQILQVPFTLQADVETYYDNKSYSLAEAMVRCRSAELAIQLVSKWPDALKAQVQKHNNAETGNKLMNEMASIISMHEHYKNMYSDYMPSPFNTQEKESNEAMMTLLLLLGAKFSTSEVLMAHYSNCTELLDKLEDCKSIRYIESYENIKARDYSLKNWLYLVAKGYCTVKFLSSGFLFNIHDEEAQFEFCHLIVTKFTPKVVCESVHGAQFVCEAVKKLKSAQLSRLFTLLEDHLHLLKKSPMIALISSSYCLDKKKFDLLMRHGCDKHSSFNVNGRTLLHEIAATVVKNATNININSTLVYVFELLTKPEYGGYNIYAQDTVTGDTPLHSITSASIIEQITNRCTDCTKYFTLKNNKGETASSLVQQSTCTGLKTLSSQSFFQLLQFYERAISSKNKDDDLLAQSIEQFLFKLLANCSTLDNFMAHLTVLNFQEMKSRLNKSILTETIIVESNHTSTVLLEIANRLSFKDFNWLISKGADPKALKTAPNQDRFKALSLYSKLSVARQSEIIDYCINELQLVPTIGDIKCLGSERYRDQMALFKLFAMQKSLQPQIYLYLENNNYVLSRLIIECAAVPMELNKVIDCIPFEHVSSSMVQDYCEYCVDMDKASIELFLSKTKLAFANKAASPIDTDSEEETDEYDIAKISLRRVHNPVVYYTLQRLGIAIIPIEEEDEDEYNDDDSETSSREEQAFDDGIFFIYAKFHPSILLNLISYDIHKLLKDHTILHRILNMYKSGNHSVLNLKYVADSNHKKFHCDVTIHCEQYSKFGDSLNESAAVEQCATIKKKSHEGGDDNEDTHSSLPNENKLRSGKSTVIIDGEHIVNALNAFFIEEKKRKEQDAK